MIELDKRIIEGKRPLTAFDVMESKFIGTDCYFSDNASDYGDLSNCQLGCLLSADGMTGVFNAKKNNSYANFNYCLPAKWVREEELAPKHIDFEKAKKDKNFELCELYGEELLFDTKNDIFYTSDGNVHGYLTAMAQHRAQEEKEEQLKEAIEKKYRPYTIKDFEKAFLNDEFDDFIIFRDKHNPDDIYTMRYNGNFRKGQFEYICLGAKNFSFESLFENYEVADYDGDWQPFGILEE